MESDALELSVFQSSFVHCVFVLHMADIITFARIANLKVPLNLESFSKGCTVLLVQESCSREFKQTEMQARMPSIREIVTIATVTKYPTFSLSEMKF